MKKGILFALIVVIAAALLSGCVGAPAPTPDGTPLPSGVTASPTPVPTPIPTVSPTKQPELLLTKSEAEMLVGSNLNDGKVDTTKADGMTLVFYGSPVEKGRFLQVMIYQRNEEAVAIPQLRYNALKKDMKNVFNDIGDEAFITAPGLHMMVNGYYVVVACGDPAKPENVEILKKAGKALAEKLKK